MDKEQLAKFIAEKFDEALKASDHPKKFFITANGRGVTDGGDLYNALLKDVVGVVATALTEVIQGLSTPAPAPAPEPKPEPKPAKSTEKAEKSEKLAKGKK